MSAIMNYYLSPLLGSHRISQVLRLLPQQIHTATTSEQIHMATTHNHKQIHTANFRMLQISACPIPVFIFQRQIALNSLAKSLVIYTGIDALPALLRVGPLPVNSSPTVNSTPPVNWSPEGTPLPFYQNSTEYFPPNIFHNFPPKCFHKKFSTKKINKMSQSSRSDICTVYLV